MRRKFLFIVLIMMIAIFGLNINTKAVEFNESNESYYNSICNGYIAADSSNRAVCQEYKKYLQNKAQNASQRLEEIKQQIANSTAELSKIEALSRQLSVQMEEIYAQLSEAEAQVSKIEDGILKVEASIEEKTAAAEKRKQMILDRIPSLAVKANTNQYIDFIMGASDLVDLIQRSTSIETFTKYDKEMITSYQKEIKVLEEENKEQKRLKEQLVVYMEDLELKEQELEVLYQENQALASAYHEKLEEEIARKTEAERLVQVANANANKIIFNEPITSSGYLICPVQAGYTSAGTWAYPTGGVHRGLDKAVPIGTPIYAPANGVVLEAITGVNSSGGGYLGNMAGYPYGGGNTLHILVEANGQVYGITFMHMSENIISKGARISQWQVIGYTGNTGNTTGPHCHIEVYRLNMSFQQALSYWNTHFDWAWGCGWGAGPSCSTAGCRIRPESLGW